MDQQDIQPMLEEGGHPPSPLAAGDVPQEQARKREKKLFLMRVCLAETLCTFIFLFTVMAMGVNTKALKAPSNTAESALVTGFVAVAMVYSFGDISGAHFNPAVTVATMIIGKTTWKKGSLYIIGQLLASVAASFWILALFGFDQDVARSLVVKPPGDYWHAFLMEATLTFILCFVIFSTAFGESATSTDQNIRASEGHKGYTIYTINANSKSGFAGIAIGLTLGFLTMLGGSVSGGVFNPARAFGPAICSLELFSDVNVFPAILLYAAGDFTGAALAAITQRAFGTMHRFESEHFTCRGLAVSCLPGFLTRRFCS
eukprot:EG_transcript_19390